MFILTTYDTGDLVSEGIKARAKRYLLKDTTSETRVEGLPNREISARLHPTEGAVKNHVSAIIAKLQANDQAHAVVTAVRRDLVEL